MAAIASQVVSLRDKSFNSMEDALAFLQEADPDVNWAKADEFLIRT